MTEFDKDPTRYHEIDKGTYIVNSSGPRPPDADGTKRTSDFHFLDTTVMFCDEPGELSDYKLKRIAEFLHIELVDEAWKDRDGTAKMLVEKWRDEFGNRRMRIVLQE